MTEILRMTKQQVISICLLESGFLAVLMYKLAPHPGPWTVLEKSLRRQLTFESNWIVGHLNTENKYNLLLFFGGA